MADVGRGGRLAHTPASRGLDGHGIRCLRRAQVEQLEQEAFTEDAIDFIGPIENLKRLCKLPYAVVRRGSLPSPCIGLHSLSCRTGSLQLTGLGSHKRVVAMQWYQLQLWRTACVETVQSQVL